MPDIISLCKLRCLALLFSISIINADYGTNNKGWVIEIQPITYEGHAQCQPSSWYQGNSPARAYLRFTGGKNGDTGRVYSKYGSSKYDSKIYKALKYHYDSWSYGVPKTKFYYGFDWVPTNSNIWPISLT